MTLNKTRTKEIEEAIVEGLDPRLHWIMRDKNGNLHVCTEKPVKRDEYWIAGDFNGICLLPVKEGLFQSVRWTDPEPTLLRSFLEKPKCDAESDDESQPLNAEEAADYIVEKCVREQKEITNLELQTMLYCVQRRFLRKYDRPAFFGIIEAWSFGPAVPDVYYDYSGYGGMLIDSPAHENYRKSNRKDAAEIDDVINKVRNTDPYNLLAQIRRPDGAWARTYKNGRGNYEVISHREMIEHG